MGDDFQAILWYGLTIVVVCLYMKALLSSLLELLCDGCNVLPLMKCLLQLKLSWLS